MNLHINRGPRMVEVRRTPVGKKWCFGCRKHLDHDEVVMAQPPEDEPSPHGEPYALWLCSGCGLDRASFPQ